jgi:hypothetical protein
MTDQPGGPLGKALAQMLAEAFMQAHGATVDATQQARIEATLEAFEAAEDHLRPIMTGMLGNLRGHPDLPPGFDKILEDICETPQGFSIVNVLLTAFGAVIGIIPAVASIYSQALKNDLWSHNPTMPIAPADLADMVERNIVTQEFGETYAAQSGVSAAAFDLLVQNTGEPPGIVDMLRLFRRGVLTVDQMETIVYYSRVRNEWFDNIIASAYDTMGAADAIEATLKGVISQTDSETLFGQAGGLTDQFQTLLDTAGDAIGVEQAATLYDHSLITDDDFVSVILHSRINPLFEPMAHLLTKKFLPAFQIMDMVKSGSATQAQAAAWLVADGYDPDQVSALVGAATSEKVAALKALGESQIVELFNVGQLTQAQAELELESIGYNAQEADYLLSIYAQKRKLAIANQAVASVRKEYLDNLISDAQVLESLAGLGVQTVLADQYLAVWKIEFQMSREPLSVAQIGYGYQSQALSDEEAIKRLMAHRYTADDAAIILSYYGGPKPTGSTATGIAATNE